MTVAQPSRDPVVAASAGRSEAERIAGLVARDLAGADALHVAAAMLRDIHGAIALHAFHQRLQQFLKRTRRPEVLA